MNNLSNEQSGFICEWESNHELRDISLSSDSASLTSAITSTSDSTLFTAFYDKYDTLIAVKQSPVSGAASEQTVTVPVAENEKGFSYVKAFLWNKAFSPLCPSRILIKADRNNWTYKRAALYDEEAQHYVLTPDYTAWTAGAIWFNTRLYDDFTIELDYYTGTTNRNLNGGDGLAVAFYANPTTEPQDGGGFGFTGCGGYGIELDTWVHSFDPQYLHIGLIKNDILDHLAYSQIAEVEDEKWHHLKVVVKDLLCYAYVDGNLKITQAVSKTEYGGLAISASTGDAENLHSVKNIYISY